MVLERLLWDYSQGPTGSFEREPQQNGHLLVVNGVQKNLQITLQMGHFLCYFTPLSYVRSEIRHPYRPNWSLHRGAGSVNSE